MAVVEVVVVVVAADFFLGIFTTTLLSPPTTAAIAAACPEAESARPLGQCARIRLHLKGLACRRRLLWCALNKGLCGLCVYRFHQRDIPMIGVSCARGGGNAKESHTQRGRAVLNGVRISLHHH